MYIFYIFKFFIFLKKKNIFHYFCFMYSKIQVFACLFWKREANECIFTKNKSWKNT